MFLHIMAVASSQGDQVSLDPLFSIHVDVAIATAHNLIAQIMQ